MAHILALMTRTILMLVIIRVMEINRVALYLRNFIITMSLINNKVFQFVLPQLGNQNKLAKKLTRDKQSSIVQIRFIMWKVLYLHRGVNSQDHPTKTKVMTIAEKPTMRVFVRVFR